MPRFIRSWALLSLAALLFLATAISCSKKTDDPIAPPTTGSLSGTISPAGAVSRVTATNAGGLAFLATPNATTGAFSIDKLAPGVYTLSFTPASGYAAPADRSITIAAGQQAAAGTVVADSDGSIRSGTMSWTVNGVTYTTTNITGGFAILGGAGQSLHYTATAVNGTDTAVLEITLGGYGLGVGTYTLGGLYQGTSYRLLRGGNVVEEYTYGGATGSFTTTAYSASTGVAMGTFGYTIDGPNSTRVVISNGSFTLHF